MSRMDYILVPPARRSCATEIRHICRGLRVWWCHGKLGKAGGRKQKGKLWNISKKVQRSGRVGVAYAIHTTEIVWD